MKHYELDPLHRNYAKGERNPMAKLNRAKVREIRQLRGMGVPLKELARRFNVSFGTVQSIVYNQTWRNV